MVSEHQLEKIRAALAKIACGRRPPLSPDKTDPVALTRQETQYLARAVCVAMDWSFGYRDAWPNDWANDRER